VTKQPNASVVIVILNIPFVLVGKDNSAMSPLLGHLYSLKNDIKDL